MKQKWTNDELVIAVGIIDYRRVSLTTTDPLIIEVAEKLGRTKYSVIKKLTNTRYKKKWEEWVVLYSRDYTYKETAERVGMSVSGLEKVIARTKGRMNATDKHERKTPAEIKTLMSSSNLPSYTAAQFLVKSGTRSQKLFDKTFNIGGKWVHGMLVDDYWDLFEEDPPNKFKSSLEFGPLKKKAWLVPWLVIPEHEILGKYIECLCNYQIYLYGAMNKEHALHTLKDLLERPKVVYENIDLGELKRKTKEAHASFCKIKEYHVNTTTESHRKNRYILRGY